MVIHESFIDECLDDSILGLDNLVLDKKTNFLIFSQITGNNPENDRKNIFYTIKWLNEVFKDNPDVGIVIKTNLGRQTILDQINCVSIITKVVNETKIGTNGPSFYLLHGDMTNKEVVGLYRHPKIKALISLTHGEGFGLPILEAAANGLPVIVTNWSAHTEFLSKGKFVKIDYNLGIQLNGRVYYPLKGKTPNHKSLIPTASYQFGFMGSLRLNPKATGLIGYAYRKDELNYQAENTTALSAGYSNNRTSVVGHYLNFLIEWDY